MMSLAEDRTDSKQLERDLRSALSLFKYKTFSDKQDQLIRASVNYIDVLGVLPTGGGKSACFQVPGIITRDRTLVVSPLIALQEDQISALRKLGVKAFALHSNMDESRKQAVHFYFKTAPKTEPSFLYISPELLMTEMFHQRFEGVGFSRLAVDEAHCCSTWGDSFRPDYQRIRVASQRLQIKHCSAFTATVDKKIEADIRKRIPLRPDFLKVAEDPMRPNLTVAVTRLMGSTLAQGARAHFWYKFATLLAQLKHPQYAGPTIIYWNSIDGIVRLYLRLMEKMPFLQETGYTPLLFHAGLPYEDKESALRTFQTCKKPLMIATSAFGMGINRADVRQIIHYRIPRVLSEYAQQIGRGGRDGYPALCTTYLGAYDNNEFELERVAWDAPDYDFVERMLGNLHRSVERIKDPQKRRRYNIGAFKHWMRKRIQDSDQIHSKSNYETRFLTSLALLQRVGLIQEGKNGLAVNLIEPGSPKQEKLLELTKMHERMLVREQERVQRFFSAPAPSQRMLWDIMAED